MKTSLSKHSPGKYIVGIIQNQSELNQYSYADAFSLINEIFNEYQVKVFNADNISDLFYESIDEYDGLVISTNACDDIKIYKELEKNKGDLEAFLNKGKGIFVLFQRKPASLSFLPERYDVSWVERNEPNLLKGTIDISSKGLQPFLLEYPNRIMVQQIINNCSKNPDLRGLYWRYLEPKQVNSYDVLLEDGSYNPPKPLLLSSQIDFQGRIITTSLLLDWQRHIDLFVNCLRYVVEGRPYVAILKRNGMASLEFQYLLDNLKFLKIPFAEYQQDKPDITAIPPIYQTVILDPSWSKEYIIELEKQIAKLFSKKQSFQIVYFDMTSSHTKIAKTVGGDRYYDLLSRRLIAWLYSNFNVTKKLWDGSFLSTSTVLDVLMELYDDPKEIRDLYSAKILEFAETHVKENGSYDNVFGATCELLKVYNLLVGQGDGRFVKAKNWLVKNLEENSRLLPEKVLCILTLKKLDIAESEKFAEGTYLAVLDDLQITSSPLAIERYAEFLLIFGHTNHFSLIVDKFRETQDKETGSWGSVKLNASITRTLLSISEKTRDAVITEKIDKIIFRSIFALKESIKGGFRPNPADERTIRSSDLVLAVLALRDFENQTKFNVDNLINNLRAPSDVWHPVRAEEISVNIRDILMASQFLRNENSRLSSDLELYKNRYQESSELKQDLIFAQNSTLLFLILFLFFLVSTILLIILTIPSDAKLVLQNWSEWLVWIIPSGAFLALIILSYYLGRFKRMPQWVRSFLSFLDSIRK